LEACSCQAQKAGDVFGVDEFTERHEDVKSEARSVSWRCENSRKPETVKGEGRERPTNFSPAPAN
jgi:hypothetical protein